MFPDAKQVEVFTLPPFSTWNPYGFHPFHMEYVLAGITAISAIPSHLESMWIPSFHMDFPSGIHMEKGNYQKRKFVEHFHWTLHMKKLC